MMPTVIKVPVRDKIPAEYTRPCAEPQEPSGGVTMESQLGAGGMGWRITAKCNADKLRAIAAGQQP